MVNELTEDQNRFLRNYILAAPIDRLIANIIDGVFMIIVVLMGGLLFGALFDEFGIFLGSFIIPFLIQLYFWSKATTFGMSIMKLTCVNKYNGQPLGLGYMAVKNIIGTCISSMVLYLGYIWILLDRDNQGWHDKLVNGVVIKNK